MDPLTLVTGVRLSQWKQEGAGSSSKLNNEWTPYGGLILDITPQWSVYASYAQIFQPQTQTTWDGQTLDPVKGTNMEIGIKGELLDGRVNSSLALFNIRQRNRAQVDPAYPCAGMNCFYIGGGEVESQANTWRMPSLKASPFPAFRPNTSRGCGPTIRFPGTTAA
jgi:outer membrane receptor for ferric coprogen and ferric-rhodotorulic acid